MQRNFRARDYASFTSEERRIWQSGRWRNESHNGHLGWWWVTGGFWYFYQQPVYPYPTNVSDYTYPAPAIDPRYRYYCGDPPGYFPTVKACYDPWQLIPATAPRSDPKEIASAGEEVRAGYRIAQDICSACHVIHPSEGSKPALSQPGPRFEEVANRPATTVESLQHFLLSTGWDVDSRLITMPSQNLSDESARDVALYIVSLRTQK